MYAVFLCMFTVQGIHTSVPCRQAVPLTVALLNVSNPNLNAVDTLSRLSHDTDIQVAQNAVLALGKSHCLKSFTVRLSKGACVCACCVKYTTAVIAAKVKHHHHGLVHPV